MGKQMPILPGIGATCTIMGAFVRNEWKRHRRPAGPGGIYCPCCNPYNCHPKKAKPFDRRLIRRKLKQELVQELRQQ